MLMNYYRHINRDQIQFDFICNKVKPGAYDDEAKSLGARIFHSPGLNPLRYPQYLAFFKKLVETYPEYKLIEVHNGSLGLYALNSAKHAGIPVRIYHAHGQGLNKDYKIILKWICKNMLKYNMTHHFTCGVKAGEYYFGSKIMARGDYVLVRNAIEINKFLYNENIRTRIRREFGLEDRHVVGHVGRFMHQKNHSFLVEVFAQILKNDRKAVLVLLGDGELQHKIQLHVDKLGISNQVLMVGNVGNANEWYQAFDLFLLPSHWEGLPVVGVEAQASDLPCIFSSSITTEIKFTDNVMFLTLDSGIKKWSDEALKILSSPVTRRNMREVIVKKGYDIETEAKKLEQLYLQIYQNTLK